MLMSTFSECNSLYGAGTDIDYGWCHYGKLNANKGSGLRFAALASGNSEDFPGCG